MFIKCLLYAGQCCKSSATTKIHSLMESKIQTQRPPHPWVLNLLASFLAVTLRSKVTSSEKPSILFLSISVPQYSPFPANFSIRKNKTKHLLTPNDIFKYLYIFTLTKFYKEMKVSH